MATHNINDTTPSWAQVDDHDATTGNGYVTVTCDGGYKGRTQRTCYATIQTTGQTQLSAVINIIQSAEVEYITFDHAIYTKSDSGDSLLITGKTNAPKLAFSITDMVGGTFVTLPTYFTLKRNGVTVYNNNAAVSGQVFSPDYGASEELTFEITVTVAANTTISSRSCRITATDSNNSVSGFADITQAAGSSYINLTSEHLQSTTVTFDADGLNEDDGESFANVGVNSNDNWNVSVQ